jgi:hypothetical protein
MRLPMAFLAAGAALIGGTAQAASVEVKDAVARVTVIPENRTDVKVEFLHNNPKLPLQVRTLGGRTILDGDLDRKIRSCGGRGQPSVHVSGIGDIGWNDMPQVVIRTPRNAEFSAGGAVFGNIGRSASLEFGNAGCGDWTIGNVDGRMHISQAGSGDIRAGSAGEARVRVAGSGDIATAAVRGPVEVDVAGSGNVSVGAVQGPLDVKIAGSGDVKVLGGHATAMTVSVAGSGDVSFDGVADSLKARVAGSGDVRAREVKGEVSKSILGSGGVTIGH